MSGRENSTTGNTSGQDIIRDATIAFIDALTYASFKKYFNDNVIVPGILNPRQFDESTEGWNWSI